MPTYEYICLDCGKEVVLFVAFEGSRERVCRLSVLQQQAHGAIDLQRHDEDKSEELNGRRLALISRLHVGRNRS